MAEINIERKKSVWPWIIGAIVLILIIWALFALFDRNDRVVAPVAAAPTAAPEVPMTAAPIETTTADTTDAIAPMPAPPTDDDNAPIPVPLIIVGPAQFMGQPVIGTATVAGVPSDRGFWLENEGERIYAVIAKSPSMEDAVNVNPGQEVRVAGVVYDNALAGQISGGLEHDTMQIVADQPAFLLVDARNVQVLN